MNPTNKPTILVTGGAGFIGVNLCKALLKNGLLVYCADNLITGHHQNIKPLLKNNNFNYTKLDITTPDFFHHYKDIKFNQIYHLACPTGVPNIQKLGKEMLLTCSTGTFNVMELAKKNNAQVLFTSSCEVYGQATVSPQKESYNGNVSTIGQRSPYEEGKRFAESVTTLYAKKYNLDTKIVRFFNVYGPGMNLNDQRVIPQDRKSVV